MDIYKTYIRILYFFNYIQYDTNETKLKNEMSCKKKVTIKSTNKLLSKLKLKLCQTIPKNFFKFSELSFKKKFFMKHLCL